MNAIYLGLFMLLLSILNGQDRRVLTAPHLYCFFGQNLFPEISTVHGSKNKQISIDPRGSGSSLFAIHQPQVASRIADEGLLKGKRDTHPPHPPGRAFLEQLEVCDLLQKITF